MTVCIQSNKDMIPYNPNAHAAYIGFKELGFETICFLFPGEIPTITKDDVVVGGLGVIEKCLSTLGIKLPSEESYPPEISRYLGRKIWKSDITYIKLHPFDWPVFIKPVRTKLFSGRIIKEYQDTDGLFSVEDDGAVYVSEVVKFESEYRVFVKSGQIQDVKHYKGEWSVYPDSNVITACISDYIGAPAAYAADFGVTNTGRTLLIEVNDGYSIGAYGLDPVLYAEFLYTRWNELIRKEDSHG